MKEKIIPPLAAAALLRERERQINSIAQLARFARASVHRHCREVLLELGAQKTYEIR